jgi:hypothetical protein
MNFLWALILAVKRNQNSLEPFHVHLSKTKDVTFIKSIVIAERK